MSLAVARSRALDGLSAPEVAVPLKASTTSTVTDASRVPLPARVSSIWWTRSRVFTS